MRKTIWFTALLCLFLAPIHTLAVESNRSYDASVIADSLNVRKDAAAKATIVATLKNGQKVTVLNEAYGWSQVQTNGVKGWVAGYLLSKNTSNTNSSSKSSNTISSKQVTVLYDGLRIREGPGTKYSIRGSVNKGNLLTIIRSSNDWHKIKTDAGVEGWVHSQFVGNTNTSHSANATQVVHVAANHSKGLAGRTIVVDPGHGGSDPGAIGTTHKTYEKELNLSTALFLRQELLARGANVIMTRTENDQKVSLSNRASLTRTQDADAFISIHYNSSETKTSGILTFFQSETKDIRLTRSVEQRLSNGDIGLKSNGIAYGDYHVLRENSVPSTLVELGFLTNAKDEGIVRKSTYQKKAAEAIADGLADFFAK